MSETRVKLRIDNVYADGYEQITTAMATVPVPLSYEHDALNAWAQEHLWDYTGTDTGRGNIDAHYAVLIEDSAVPELRGQRFEFS